MLTIIGFSNSQAQELAPYLKIGIVKMDMAGATSAVKAALEEKGFSVIGSYHPEEKANMTVIAYTRKDLYNTCLRVKDRGALAAILKVGLIYENGNTEISMTNPEYIFNAYLQDNIKSLEAGLKTISNEAKNALSTVAKDFTPFGGGITPEKLHSYRYMVGMQTFDDPVELATFNSFNEGVAKIKANLAAKKGGAYKVYSLTFNKSQVAVFGVALSDKDDGEAHFLPIIGEKHLAALPYEIILQGNKATMLHGRFRIALHWPELTMGTFTKIMSSPGDIEDMLKAVCE